MSAADDWSFEACGNKLRAATRIVLDAENAYEVAAGEAANTEALYRKEYAHAYQTHRTGGAAVAEAETLARGEVVVHSRARDYAAAMLKLRGEKLEDARDSRRSLWRLIEWARGVALARESATAGRDEREPADRWP